MRIARRFVAAHPHCNLYDTSEHNRRAEGKEKQQRPCLVIKKIDNKAGNHQDNEDIQKCSIFVPFLHLFIYL